MAMTDAQRARYNAYHRSYYAAHKEEGKRAVVKWQKENIEYYRDYQKKYRREERKRKNTKKNEL